ncbi:unnamed protein product [Boreogadus saida]
MALMARERTLDRRDFVEKAETLDTALDHSTAKSPDDLPRRPRLYFLAADRETVRQSRTRFQEDAWTRLPRGSTARDDPTLNLRESGSSMLFLTREIYVPKRPTGIHPRESRSQTPDERTIALGEHSRSEHDADPEELSSLPRAHEH